MFVFKLDNNSNGTEDLLPHYHHIGFCVREDCRVDEVPFAAEAIAPEVDCGPGVPSGFDVSHDTLQRGQYVRSVGAVHRGLLHSPHTEPWRPVVPDRHLCQTGYPT